MSLHKCKGCSDQIPTEKARVRCATCLNYDLCASCFLVGNINPPHQTSHQTTLFKTSGLVPTAGPSYPVQQQQLQPQQQLFPQSTLLQNVQQQQQQQSPFQQPNIGAATGMGWQIFFNPTDWSPSPSFLSLMQAFFTHLDPQNSGTLTPEAYASFLDAEGYSLTQNTWRNALTSAQPTADTTREAQADMALKRAYGAFGIDHKIGQRPGTRIGAGQYPFNSILPGFPSGSMPLLTLNGFVSITAMEALFDPNKGHADLNRALQKLNIPLLRTQGEIPRWALPATAPPQILQKASEAQRNMAMQTTNMATVNTMGNTGAMNTMPGAMMYYGAGPQQHRTGF